MVADDGDDYEEEPAESAVQDDDGRLALCPSEEGKKADVLR